MISSQTESMAQLPIVMKQRWLCLYKEAWNSVCYPLANGHCHFSINSLSAELVADVEESIMTYKWRCRLSGAIDKRCRLKFHYDCVWEAQSLLLLPYLYEWYDGDLRWCPRECMVMMLIAFGDITSHKGPVSSLILIEDDVTPMISCLVRGTHCSCWMRQCHTKGDASQVHLTKDVGLKSWLCLGSMVFVIITILKTVASLRFSESCSVQFMITQWTQ